MKLYEIIQGIKIKNTVGNLDIEILSLSCDSRMKSDDSLFFCIDGNEIDSHELYKDAINNGAIALVVEKILPVVVPQILVNDARLTMSLCSKNFYGKADESLKIIAVVGTNGKTTTSYMVCEILKQMGKSVGVIGTCGIVHNDTIHENPMTTPDPINLHKTFRAMADGGVEYVVIEISAHAIYLKKMQGVICECAIFTNITQDHLDFFETMENYSLTKMSYFTVNNVKMGIINVDDNYGRKIVGLDKIKTITYGLENPSDIFAINYNIALGGTAFVANIGDNVFEVNLKLSGRFNIYNALSAGACCYYLGATPQQIKAGLENLRRVDGRFNLIKADGGYDIIVDFAHTEDALFNLLKTIKESANTRIILVFGCGGNRDTKKRPLMGAVADKFADEIIITTDNSRFEEQEVIASDIIAGIKNKSYIAISDRSKAIEYALSIAMKDDVVVVAGKGQEKYQEIMGKKAYFNDEEEILKILNR